jgi:hypothetical protein
MAAYGPPRQKPYTSTNVGFWGLRKLTAISLSIDASRPSMTRLILPFREKRVVGYP